MFYHLHLEVLGNWDWFIKNKTLDELLQSYICPFIQNEITIHEGKIFNMTSYGSIQVFLTEKPIDSDWPIPKDKFLSQQGIFDDLQYEKGLREYLLKSDVTSDVYKKALIRIADGSYKEIRKIYENDLMGNSVFFICPFGDKTIDHNYKYAITPAVRECGYTISRVDEEYHTDQVTEKIIECINKSRFIIADLTNERPNCYYEVGYAHALQKPVIIIAKNDTKRHFDISTYKWIYWKNYKDLKSQLMPEIKAIISKF